MTIVGEAVAPIIMGYCGYYGEYGDCLSHTAGMLWGDWRVCVIETLCLPLAKGRFQAFCPWRVGNCNSKPGVPEGSALSRLKTIRGAYAHSYARRRDSISSEDADNIVCDVLEMVRRIKNKALNMSYYLL